MAKKKKNVKTKMKKAVTKPKARPKARPEVRPKAMPKMKRMPKKDLKKFKELLIKIRTQVGGDLSHITENTLNKSARDASGDLSGYSYHMADQASDDYERDFSLGRATDEQKILYSIDEALKRIEDGSYGNCPQCRKLISKKRLAALPQTELCIDCQKKNEAK
jgi:DnaK suppressor protein